MTQNEHSRRRFLKYGGAAGAVGLTSLSGCMMLQGSLAPNMKPMMMEPGLSLHVTRGAPAKGNYPAKPGGSANKKLAKKEEKMGAVGVLMIAYQNQTNNYHFMPHVMWIEPGTTVFWKHTNQGISEDRTHTTTSIKPNLLPGYPRLIPTDAEGWDSGFMPGAMKAPYEKVASKEGMIHHGPHMHTFEKPGVYFYLCENHFGFGMAGAIVVGRLFEKTVKKMSAAKRKEMGWAPGMTMPKKRIHNMIMAAEEDPRFAKTIAHKITGPLRMMIKHGKKPKGGHTDDRTHGGETP